jgi:hypothetical protein
MSKKTALTSLLLCSFFASSAFAGGLSCEALKAKIVKKLEGKGVKNYELTIVDKNTETKNRVVGTCEAGSKKIIYERLKAKS